VPLIMPRQFSYDPLSGQLPFSQRVNWTGYLQMSEPNRTILKTVALECVRTITSTGS